MTEGDTITTMEEFMKRLNGTRAEVCQEFRKMFIGMGIPENEADRPIEIAKSRNCRRFDPLNHEPLLCRRNAAAIAIGQSAQFRFHEMLQDQ